jgi:hypothetical protein
MTMQSTAIYSHSLCHSIHCAEARGQHQVNAFAHGLAQLGSTPGCKRVKVLLDLLRHNGICCRDCDVNVVRRADHAIEILIEPNLDTKKPPMRVQTVRRCMGKTNRLRSPPLSKQPLEAAMKKPDPKLNRLTHR